ncbi:cytochrome c oxidase assembly protein PET191-domain-containing protein [Phellopilus nigrolimitatus]|nr:cytochrome c oxidase assembly protein PET191-domain-containing protein [Phellopilus nigrolimitatus]
MSSSCHELIDLLKDCLMRSDCVVKQGHLPSECLRNHMDELPEECKSIRTAVFNCKRGMLDMRKRFRGNNPGYVPPLPPSTQSSTQSTAAPS